MKGYPFEYITELELWNDETGEELVTEIVIEGEVIPGTPWTGYDWSWVPGDDDDEIEIKAFQFMEDFEFNGVKYEGGDDCESHPELQQFIGKKWKDIISDAEDYAIEHVECDDFDDEDNRYED